MITGFYARKVVDHTMENGLFLFQSACIVRYATGQQNVIIFFSIHTIITIYPVFIFGWRVLYDSEQPIVYIIGGIKYVINICKVVFM